MYEVLVPVSSTEIMRQTKGKPCRSITNVNRHLLCGILAITITTNGINGEKYDGKSAEKIPLYIGGIFPFSDTDVFLGSFPRTVLAAIDHVNNMTGLLDDYELKMKWGWTFVSTFLHFFAL